eukprot:5244726-Prymnesium_polylepis.1
MHITSAGARTSSQMRDLRPRSSQIRRFDEVPRVEATTSFQGRRLCCVHRLSWPLPRPMVRSACSDATSNSDWSPECRWYRSEERDEKFARIASPARDFLSVAGEHNPV